MSLLKRVSDFTAPKDEASAIELRRQLVAFQGNVSDMSDRIGALAMPRLGQVRPGVVQDSQTVLYPGSFQLFDTTAGNIDAALAKPDSSGSGTFVVVVDVATGANNLTLHAESGCTVNATDSVLVTTFLALLFCDGVNYWRLV